MSVLLKARSRKTAHGGRLHSRPRPWHVAVALFLLSCPWAAFALDPALRLDQYHHRVYSPLGSAPTESWALVQTDDGYLWDGTFAGLFRFDGAAFERISSLGNQSIANLPVQTLIPEPGGGLWIGYAGGAGSGHYKAGHYTALGPETGWANLVSGAIDADGVLWASLNGHLARVDASGKQVLDASWGLPETGIEEVVIDKAGTIWVSTASKEGLLYLPHGERRFRWIGRTMRAPILVAAPDGTIFATGPSGLWAVITRDGRPVDVVQVSAMAFGKVLVDRDGGLFAWNLKKLFHISSAKRLVEPGGERLLLSDSFTLKQDEGLSPPLISAIREDNEGNLWVASTSTLERFSNSPFTSIWRPGESFTFGVVPGELGTVWAANWDSHLLNIDPHSKVVEFADVGPGIECIYRDRTGTIWVAAPTGLWRSDGQRRFSRVPISNDLLFPWVVNMTLDGSGNLWFSTGGLVGHLVRGSPSTGDWRRIAAGEGFGELPMAHAMMTDSLGRAWFGQGTSIIRVENGVPRTLDALSAALEVGAILTFSEGERHIWVGGLNGLAVVRGDRVSRLKVRDGVAFNRVAAIVETPEGDLWVRGADDAWRIPAAELRRALAEDRPEVAVEHFDALDGLGGMALNPKSTMARTSEGVMWFGTRQGLAWIDPRRPRPPPPVPVRHIRSVSIDGHTVAPGNALTLPALTRRVEIAYTAIELGYPERIQFRYKLEGFDRDWHLAGTRRVAYYNDLPPGDYRFRVTSTNRDGLWQDQGEAILDIHADAAWFQSTWFKLAVALLVLISATLFYRLRLRQVATRLRLRLNQQLAERERIATARQAERDRIARELHDTLLQGVYGLTWKFQALAGRVPPGDPLHQSMIEALKGADRILREGRNRVLNLRTAANAAAVIIDELEQTVDEIDSMSSTIFLPSSDGDDIDLLPAVHDEVLKIAAEGLRNAYRHADATRIELRLHYDPREFRLEVIDDGSGIPATILDKGKADHWGLAGMRERARSIGALLDITAREGGGTVVALRMRGTLAYGPRPTTVNVPPPVNEDPNA